MSTTRREFLAAAAAATAAATLARFSFARTQPATQIAPAARAARSPRYRISASDWMMLKRQTPGALQRASECDLDGVEVDMGPLGKRPTFENKLLDDKFLADYVAKANELNLQISSLAMSAFYGQAFADHPKADEFLAQWIELMPKLHTKVGFLPIITKDKADLATNKEVRANLVARLKTAAPLAEKADVVIGLNTSMDAAGDKLLLDEVGSHAVRIAYNCGEAIDAGRDPLKDLRELGKDRIAQIIPTLSDGVWLQNDTRLDMKKLKQLLDEIGWSGWLVLQRSRDANKSKDVKYNFSANAAYLKSIFQTA